MPTRAHSNTTMTCRARTAAARERAGTIGSTRPATSTMRASEIASRHRQAARPHSWPQAVPDQSCSMSSQPGPALTELTAMASAAMRQAAIGKPSQRCLGNASCWMTRPASRASAKRSSVKDQSHWSSAAPPEPAWGAACRALITSSVLASASHSTSGTNSCHARVQGPWPAGSRASAALDESIACFSQETATRGFVSAL